MRKAYQIISISFTFLYTVGNNKLSCKGRDEKYYFNSYLSFKSQQSNIFLNATLQLYYAGQIKFWNCDPMNVEQALYHCATSHFGY